MGWLMYGAFGAFILLALAAALAAWMVFLEPRRFRIWRIRVPRKNSRASDEIAVRASRLPPLRILHITDTHFGTRDQAKLEFLRRVAGESYDLAFLTGDLIDVPAGIEPCLKMVRMLTPRIGIYGVLGGHDHFRGTHVLHKYTSLPAPGPPPDDRRAPNPHQKLRQELRRSGVEILSDESRMVQLPGSRPLAVVGLRDAFVFEVDYEAAWDEVPTECPTVVIAHSPDVLKEVRRRGADLAFFGHTHGGQVRLPVIGAVFTRAHIGRGRARGIFREGETVFTINAGMGAGTGSDFRLLCRPEVTLLELGA
jgi:hypothetical protein